MDYILIIVGLLFLFVGGEALVRGSVTLSKRLGISTLLIGVVVVGFGTSAPELLVSIKASLKGQSDIALGNVVGSNIANVLLILGVASIIQPVKCHSADIRRDALAVMILSGGLITLSLFDDIQRGTGIVMVLLLIGYLTYAYQNEKKHVQNHADTASPTVHQSEATEFATELGFIWSLLIAIIGIVLLVFGADFLVDGASNIAKRFGISEATIGLSIVAIGTSLPEFATSISASLKKESDVVIGNVLGSNMFNILCILGITSIIIPIPFSQQISTFDIPIMFVVAALTYGLILIRKQLGRLTGFIFLGLYGAYMAWLYSHGAV